MTKEKHPCDTLDRSWSVVMHIDSFTQLVVGGYLEHDEDQYLSAVDLLRFLIDNPASRVEVLEV